MTATLGTVERIGFLGDTHGDLGHIFTLCQAMQTRDVELVVQVGDFGLIFPGRNWGHDLDRLDNRLARLGMSLLFVDGNHEWFPKLYEFPIAPDGIRWVRNSIGHLPRGYRTTLVFGRTLAALGGANSIDIRHRSLNVNWWAEEAITDRDLETLGNQPVDLLVSHDAPASVPALDKLLASTDQFWPAAALEYAARGRQNFHRGFIQVQPKLLICGHYHAHVDETVCYRKDRGEFQTRVVILNRDGSPMDQSAAILNVETLEFVPWTDQVGAAGS